jgi:hypothetical protein
MNALTSNKRQRREDYRKAHKDEGLSELPKKSSTESEHTPTLF